ncbi:hypothetical protein JZ751_004786 [Albula glossodonta]|uniref:Uncharacterized protein n=1 Tax=Albula glossodonta TaxID=121402 RepID=A0A8T2P4K2_9TELE|nr:hypothetical protein JZ751_004786 [Albula glossodonta]
MLWSSRTGVTPADTAVLQDWSMAAELKPLSHSIHKVLYYLAAESDRTGRPNRASLLPGAQIASCKAEHHTSRPSHSLATLH